MIPTIHPAATLRAKKFEARCIYDWMRIAYEGGFREVKLPQRTHKIAPTLEECVDYADTILSWKGEALAVDIETHPVEGITGIPINIGA